jgi:hypothetical protein
VVPGVSMYDVLTADYPDGRNLQIGRQPPLSSNKAATHFPILLRELDVPYDEMLFFDDSMWSDHCTLPVTNLAWLDVVRLCLRVCASARRCHGRVCMPGRRHAAHAARDDGGRVAQWPEEVCGYQGKVGVLKWCRLQTLVQCCAVRSSHIVLSVACWLALVHAAAHVRRRRRRT